MPTELPKTPDLAVSRHGQVAEAFEILADALGPFIDDRMTAYFADDLEWQKSAANRMGRAHEHGATDPLFQLLVLRRFWGPVFADFFGQDLRGLVAQLIEARNLWAHFNLPDDTNYLDRILLSVERIAAPVEPEATSRLRQIRTRLKNPTVEAEAMSAKTDVDLIALRNQLGETEGAFQELQDQFGEIKEQLDLARRASAGKQIRLTMLEQELLEASGQTAALESNLRAAHDDRHRLEWIFVVFIAAMVMVMVLLTVS